MSNFWGYMSIFPRYGTPGSIKVKEWNMVMEKGEMRCQRQSVLILFIWYLSNVYKAQTTKQHTYAYAKTKQT